MRKIYHLHLVTVNSIILLISKLSYKRVQSPNIQVPVERLKKFYSIDFTFTELIDQID